MHSTEEETQVKCDKCKKKFRTEAGLRLHERIHTRIDILTFVEHVEQYS